MREKILYAIGALAGVLLVRNMHEIFLVVPDEAAQGYIYRILFVHAPAAFVSGKLYHDASEAWRTLQQGILLVWGREAAITPISDAAAFLALNPRAQLAEVSPAGILPHDEQPQQFANTVLNWLDRLP